MRIKKPYILLTFHTTTDAMATEKACAQQNIPGRLIPLPTEISAGCGLAWRMLPDAFMQHEQQLNRLGIAFEHVVKLDL